MKYINHIAVTYQENIQNLSRLIQEIQVEGKPVIKAVHASNKVYIVNEEGQLEEKINDKKTGCCDEKYSSELNNLQD